MSQFPAIVRFSSQLSSLILSLGMTGCGGSDEAVPKVYRVTGKVMMANKEPMRGGSVEFRLVDSPTFTTIGRIQEDGSFELFTMHIKEKLPGALSGAHRVTIMPSLDPAPNEVQAAAEPIVLPISFVVKPNDGNSFTIQLKPIKSRR